MIIAIIKEIEPMSRVDRFCEVGDLVEVIPPQHAWMANVTRIKIRENLGLPVYRSNIEIIDEDA